MTGSEDGDSDGCDVGCSDVEGRDVEGRDVGGGAIVVGVAVGRAPGLSLLLVIANA